MSRLLLVEDDEALALGIEFTLRDDGYEVDRVSRVEDGKRILERSKYDLVVLDVNLPDGNGYDLCRHIRARSDTPVIFLTALDEEVNVILGLDIGGDDYITKPFRVRELISRIKAILRRNTYRSTTSNILMSGDLEVNTSNAQVIKNGKEISLTAQEYKLLLIFMQRPFVSLKREEILHELVEEEEIYFDENTLSVYIKRIREKIEDNQKEPCFIITQRGLGYKWNIDVKKE